MLFVFVCMHMFIVKMSKCGLGSMNDFNEVSVEAITNNIEEKLC